MTTDTRPKEVVVEFPLARPHGAHRRHGQGRGHDRAEHGHHARRLHHRRRRATRGCLQHALREAVGESLNRITVDGDTSTNDMAVILASGALPARAILQEDGDYRAFRAALVQAGRALAEMIVRDGEGATRIAEVRVQGARTAAEADRVARTIAESPLVKTALHGGDPNWGRILAAAGRSGVDIDTARVDIHLGDVWVAAGGAAREYDERTAAQAMQEDPVRITVALHQGQEQGWMWTCDLTRGYVEINAHYRS